MSLINETQFWTDHNKVPLLLENQFLSNERIIQIRPKKHRWAKAQRKRAKKLKKRLKEQ